MTEHRIDLSGLNVNILTIDLERLPGMTPIFDPRVRGGYIHPSRWTRLPSTLCFSAKWYGEDKVHFHAVWHKGGPEGLTRKLWDYYDRADLVVTYNGKKADNRWARDDWLITGLPPPSPWRDVDLYATNKRLFGFESASLDHLCERLGLPGKSDHYDPGVAEAAANGDREAQRLMRAYNANDTVITERAYDRLRPWLSDHPPLSMWSDSDDDVCAVCAGPINRTGWTRTQLTTYAFYRCTACQAPLRTNHRKHGARVRGAQ